MKFIKLLALLGITFFLTACASTDEAASTSGRRRLWTLKRSSGYGRVSWPPQWRLVNGPIQVWWNPWLPRL